MQILHHKSRTHHPYRICNNITNDSSSHRRQQTRLRFVISIAGIEVLAILEKREEERVKDRNGDHIGPVAWVNEKVPA